MDAEKLRAWWWHRQGLDGSLDGAAPEQVLSATGWARSVGGASPYLTLFARAGIDRATTDAAVAALRVHELPSARGCTYIVPADDYALALTSAQGFSDAADRKTALNLGVTDNELATLCEEVVAALGDGPLDPSELRTAAPTARSLGEAGKNKGMSTTLPVALGQLQTQGRIRRVPTDSRLDRQRYRYVLWSPSPLDSSTLTRERAQAELAQRFFRWAGPATMAELRWFTGLGAKAADAAIAPLELVAVDGTVERFSLPDDAEALADYTPPDEPHYSLVSSLDGLFLLRRDVIGLVADAHRDRLVSDGKRARPIAELKDLPSHAIVDRGRLIGLWEYDVATASIAWTTFEPADESLTATIERTEQFIRSDIEDARSFSLDSPKSRTPRIAALRAQDMG